MVFLDNIGMILAKLFKEPSAVGNSVIITSISGSKTVRIYSGFGVPVFNKIFVVTPQTQVGKGTTPVARSDVNTETPFTNGGIEDNRVASLLSGYSSILGKITIPTSISPTAGAGDISEVTKFIILRDTANLEFIFIIFRDIIDPTEPFIAGQNINIDHEVLI